MEHHSFFRSVHLSRGGQTPPSHLSVPQADVPGGNPQEVVVSGLQVSLQRPDPDPESQGQRPDLQTSTQLPPLQQQEEPAEPQPGRRYWQGPYTLVPTGTPLVPPLLPTGTPPVPTSTPPLLHWYPLVQAVANVAGRVSLGGDLTWTFTSRGQQSPAQPSQGCDWSGPGLLLCDLTVFVVGDCDWFSASRAASSLIGSPVFTSSPKANGGSGRVPSCGRGAAVELLRDWPLG